MRLEELFARSSIEVLGGRLWQPHEEAPAAAEAPPKRSPVLPSAAADEESPVRRKAAPAVIAKDLSCASVLTSSSVSTEALRSPTSSVSPADPQKQERLTNGRRLYAAVRREHEPAVRTLLASPRIDVRHPAARREPEPDAAAEGFLRVCRRIARLRVASGAGAAVEESDLIHACSTVLRF